MTVAIMGVKNANLFAVYEDGKELEDIGRYTSISLCERAYADFKAKQKTKVEKSDGKEKAKKAN